MKLKTDFSAIEPALGYYYQIRYSLYLLLKAREKDFDIEMSIEKLDDISIENIDSIELFQTKLHLKSITNLTNSSPDLWKTIRIWSEAIQNDKINPKKTIFILVTTANASEDSVTYELCKNSTDRNNSKILDTLEKTIDKSKSESNKKAYASFRSLSKIQKEILIKNIRILDSSLDIEDVKKHSLNELRLSTTDRYLIPFYERLEGWWFNRCIDHLISNNGNIKFKEVQCQIEDIRDKFTKDNLPIDFLDEICVEEADYDNRTFIAQLKLISIGENTLKNALSDYYRVFKQRSKWVREDLLNPNEEEQYDKRLIDDWKSKFDLMKDDLESSSKEELMKEGRNFYTSYYVKTTPSVYIREKVIDGFIVRGSCHLLSDSKKIGWHPNFEKQLEGK